MIRKILSILAFVFCTSTPAFAICTGQFPANTLCGVTSAGLPSPITNPILGGTGVSGSLTLNGSSAGNAGISVNSAGVLDLFNSQGNQPFVFSDGTNGNSFIVNGLNATIANQLRVTPSATLGTPTLSATGTDTNVSAGIASKGTGGVPITAGGGVAIDGNAPACSSTGAGSGTSCALSTGSNNSVGDVQITAGTGASSSGTFTVTFANNITGANTPVCTLTYDDTGSPWEVTSYPMHITAITAAGFTGSWNNNGTNLNSTSIYHVMYHCFGM